MRYLFLTVIIFSAYHSGAQSALNVAAWAAKPVMHEVKKQFRDDAAVFIKDHKSVEYIIEKDGFFVYKTVHRIIHINTDKGIEYFNKVYLPLNEGLEMKDVKARTVLPNGSVVTFDEKNIKEIKDDDGNTYKIFALDGLTKGCEVEYLYTLKKYPSFFGREFFSSHVPVQEARFEIITPAHLLFDIKNFNDLPKAIDTTIGNKRHLTLTAEDIATLPEEKYSMRDAQMKRIEYKLSYNRDKNPTERLFTWNELSKKAFGIYTTVNEKDSKKIKEQVANAGVKEEMTEIEKITRLENYFKKYFVNRDDISSDDANDLTKVIKNKVASNRALCKIFCEALSIAKVSFQIVLAGDRENFMVDRTFENWNNAENFLFFFPGTSKYMAPTENIYRYPWVPPTWTGTNGIFCIGTSIGNMKTAYAEVKQVPMENYEYSFLNLNVTASFDPKCEALLLEMRQSYGGYAAPNYKAPFVFYSADQQKNVLKELVKIGSNSENILSHSFENKELEQKDPYQPFIINASVRSTQLVENAGDKIILKIGDIIGQQSEMYNTKDRTSPIDLGFPHALYRTLQITLPDGYEIKNAKDLQFNEVYKDEKGSFMGFVCNYELTQNVLTVTIKEDYANIYYPLSLYNAFSKIINAAADFNTTVLVLEKKK